ncbi:PHD finger protein 7-like [Gallus gallus]|nr:PHD finger protein 7-like [Gallus gallus]XP_040512278.1 PHD finger protein 7-like [Gallus gallus]XP_040551225.2 PHD finger protein 7-like [Gallus gallus]XP_040551227.2 PHD finger protein 7-like [Gallus gallus]XP_046792048.1 PHD finger protein 7-like [Gallus gallus]XP_046792049.1 PHD finger protein 7-like [Gallus gallus]
MPIMSKGTEEAPNSGEPVCVLCRRAQVNPDICGETFANGGLCAHQFCLFFANGLLEWRSPMGGIFGFSISAVQRAVQLAEQKNCFVCGGRGAAITCAETGCERSFHLPCTEDGECITQYFGQHRSFCWEHRPRQAAEAAPSENTSCVICLEPVGDSTSYHTMVCPVCKQAWFHRGCIRKHALHAATMRFFCPVCGGKGRFRSRMTTLGIQIPVRRPSWWDDAAYQPLRERHRRCDASMCIYLGGRERAQEEGRWRLLLCSSCAAEGTHWNCSFWSAGRDTWECDTCAGAGTASRTNSELASPSTPSQELSVPSHGFTGPDNTSSGPASQAASSPSQLPELSAQPGVPAAEQDTTRSRPSEERDICQQRRGRGGRRRAPAAGARSSRTSQAPAPTQHPRQRGGGRTRSRSPLQGRAPGSQSRPRRHCGGSHATTPGAQRSTRTSAAPARPRSSRASPLPARRRQSRQRGRAHTRSRSPVGRRASTSRSRPRGGRGSRSRQRGPARARSRSRAQHHRRPPRSRSRRWR